MTARFTRPEIDDDTQIVRYVRLSTFFLYLANRAFIPSLANLRRLDDLEGRLALELNLPQFREHFNAHILPFAKINSLPPTIGGELKEMMDFSARCEWWFTELAKRRAVWCWNIYDGPSNAMWHLYGSRGVVIHSTVSKVKDALKSSASSRGLMSPVRYRPAAQLIEAAQSFDPSRRDTWPSWYMRPYLYKQPSYRYEQELRFVLGIHPSLQGGISIEIDGRKLIEGISVSPDIPRDERDLIIDIEHWNQVPNIQYPATHKYAWLDKYARIGGSPFTAVDEPESLFFDFEIPR